MIYNVQLLTTVEDCDAVIQSAGFDTSDLTFKKYSLEKRVSSSTTTTATLDADIPTVQAEISAYETILLNLPQGDARVNIENKLTKARYKLFLLQERKTNYGVMAILDLESQIGNIEASLAELAVFVAAVNARKAAL